MLLEAGGNAFDTALAGCSACIPQPGWLAPLARGRAGLRHDGPYRVRALWAAHRPGIGGSNRLRTASLQTPSDLIDFGMAPDAAVAAPRVHLEGGKVSRQPTSGCQGVTLTGLQAAARQVPDSGCAWASVWAAKSS